MNTTDPRIAVLCSSALALPTLQMLLQAGWLAGLALPSDETEAIAQAAALADSAGVPVVRIGMETSAKDLSNWIGSVRPDLCLVMGFSRRIPKKLLTRPVHGFWNVHGSPLPTYRGAVPLFWQIRDQEPESAISVHRMSAEMDRGALLGQTGIRLEPFETHGSLLARMGMLLPHLLAPLLQAIAQGVASAEQEQDESLASFQPRPTAVDLAIDPSAMDADQVDALTRAANPELGGSVIGLRGFPLRLLEVEKTEVPPGAQPGEIRLESGWPVLALTGNSAVRLSIVATPDGVFSGRRLATMLGLQEGERAQSWVS